MILTFAVGVSRMLDGHYVSLPSCSQSATSRPGPCPFYDLDIAHLTLAPLTLVNLESRFENVCITMDCIAVI